MSHHQSGPGRSSPGDDPRLDIADLYAFGADRPGRTVLIMNVNPGAAAAAFHPGAVHRLNVDTDGDAVADVAVSVVFSEPARGRQTATVLLAAGVDARDHAPVGKEIVSAAPVSLGAEAVITDEGPCRFFAGLRSDPFFADIQGIAHDFEWTGKDSLARANVFGIVLEVPDETLGVDPVIGVWGRVSIHRDGRWVSMDRGGHPAITSWFNADEAKGPYNEGEPADDRDRYLGAWTAVLERTGGYPRERALAALDQVLPDVLRYDRSRPARYPNGRALADDVIDTRLAYMTDGKVTGDGIGPHDDYLPVFPYLGPPHATGS